MAENLVLDRQGSVSSKQKVILNEDDDLLSKFQLNKMFDTDAFDE